MTSDAPVDVIVGGTWHAPQVVTALCDLGIDVRVISTVGTDWDERADVVRIPMRNMFRVASRAGLGWTGVAASFGILALRHTRPRSKVIAWSSFAGAVTTRRATLVIRGSSHIATQRDLLADGPTRQRPSTFIVCSERYEYRRAAAVTVPTSLIGNDPRWAEDGVRPVVVPYGFNCMAGTSSVVWGDRDRDRLVTGGGLTYRKGFDRLLGALGERPTGVSEFRLTGSKGSPGHMPAWWSRTSALDHEGWHTLLRTSGIFLLLSREEGMARAGLEAVAEGTPIVVTEQTGLADIARSGAGVVVDGNDSHDVRKAIASVRDEWTSYHESCLALSTQWTWLDHGRALLAALERPEPHPLP